MQPIDLKELTQAINQFAAHWSAVNAAFPEKPLILPGSSTIPGGMTQAGLVALGATISGEFTMVVERDNATQAAQATRNDVRREFLQSIKLFRKTVQGYLPESVYLKQLPAAPPVGANDRLFEDTGDDVHGIWTAINADTALAITRPLVLSDGTTQADFASALARVKQANAALPTVKERARTARATRDGDVRRAIAALRQYRKTAGAFLPPGHALLATLPTLG